MTAFYSWRLIFKTFHGAPHVVVVTTVSALVHLYSIGYMARGPAPAALLRLSVAVHLRDADAGDGRQPRRSCSSAGKASGLASYLLIGFWYHKPEANAAAIKAFVVNRVGDFGFALGIFARLHADRRRSTSTPSSRRRRRWPARPSHFFGWHADALTLICLLLFMGAMGKSAQFLLHTWLPDAMEGPTPVSALIHAATMVTAGVFMVARLSPLFELAPTALAVRDARRRHHRVLRRDRRPRAERHQARRRLFDLLAARLHVRRDGRRRLFGRHVPPVHARLLQGAAVPRLRLGHPCDASRAGHAQHGRPEEQDPVHLLDDGDRHAGADRLPAHRRLFLQGRDHRGGLSRAQPVRDLRLRHDGRSPPADRVLFLAADLQDLPRQAARPAPLRGTRTKARW